MILAQKIALDPNNAQETYLGRCALRTTGHWISGNRAICRVAI